MKIKRTNGAIGALLDEYAKALDEFLVLITDLSDTELTTIVDNETKDPDCKSIQTVLSHVVKAGYIYSIGIRNSLGEELNFPSSILLSSIEEYRIALNKMFQFQEKVFQDYGDTKIEEKDPTKKILMSWGQRYDIEQLMEHAIVHILRHRRQTESFLRILKVS